MPAVPPEQTLFCEMFVLLASIWPPERVERQETREQEAAAGVASGPVKTAATELCAELRCVLLKPLNRVHTVLG